MYQSVSINRCIIIVQFWLYCQHLITYAYIVDQQQQDSDSNCPITCICSRYNISCTDKEQTGSDVFLPMRPESFPDLNSVTVSGGKIGSISGQNLFGVNSVHRNLTLLNVSNSGITEFDNETFQGLPALRWFYLNDNSLEKVGVDPFRWNLRITRLDLSRAFSEKISVAEKQIILGNMFASTNNHFLTLRDLFLNDNNLMVISPNLFCKVEGLVQLHLSGNQLVQFTFDDNCLSTLQMLDLSNNNIASPSVNIWNNIQSLQDIDISRNPLHCDCKFTSFLAKLSTQNTLNQAQTQCATPLSLKDVSIFDVRDFGCRRSSKLVFPVLLISTLLLTVLMLRLYRTRLQRYNLPFIAGYTKLGTNEAVTPQFV
uniref:LRRCT domain-containing protein n=1 Tax=Syphacia muris TaxID=451379 RepID=A0A0N5AKM4_9BILA